MSPGGKKSVLSPGLRRIMVEPGTRGFLARLWTIIVDKCSAFLGKAF
jgi:hypothetical protein